MKHQKVKVFRITYICLTILFIGLMSSSITHAEANSTGSMSSVDNSTSNILGTIGNTTIEVENSTYNYHGTPAIHQKMTINYSSTEKAVCDIYYNTSLGKMYGGKVTFMAFGETMTQKFSESDISNLADWLIDIIFDEDSDTDTTFMDEDSDTDTTFMDEDSDTDTIFMDEDNDTDTTFMDEDTQ